MTLLTVVKAKVVVEHVPLEDDSELVDVEIRFELSDG
jgi:hypothetical protein